MNENTCEFLFSIDMDDEDLEDGEIEDDEEANESINLESSKVDKMASNSNTMTVEKALPSSPALQKETNHNNSSSTSAVKKSSSKGASKSYEDEDFMSNIESQIANVLKKEGVEPPMPSVSKRTTENEINDDESRKVSRSSKKRKRRKDRKDQKRENASSKVR
jgi:hypothetical protein